MAKRIVETYEPWCEAQVEERKRILRFIDAHPLDAHERTCVPGHLTGASILFDSTRTKVLLNHHRKLNRWLQFGGHADGDANLLGVAWRETVEESGIEPSAFSRQPIDLDVHVIPARPAKGERPAEPEHLHLDVRYLAVAPEGAEASCSDESLELRWFALDELGGPGAPALDESVRRLIDLGCRT